MACCGIDFGTTNSSLAVTNKGKPLVVPLDTNNSDPHILKSLIYVNPAHEAVVGQSAVEKYLYDLKTYPASIPKKVFTGRYIKTFGPSSGGGVGPVIFVPEIVEVDESGRGRLLQSLKSVLTSATFKGTSIFGKFYSLEDLLGLLLTQIKSRAEKVLGYELDSVVLGRPVRYVGTGDESTALQRMSRIAVASGFKNIEFELEPIGAALNYGVNINTSQNILVFDFGGGTLDVCIMKLPEKEILSVSGRPIGGDLLNSRIVETKLLRHFGSNSLINNKVDFPRHLLLSLTTWYRTTLLKNVKDIGSLQDLVVKSDQPDLVRNFLNLVINDYGYEFFRSVDAAKISLSTADSTMFSFDKPELQISEPVSISDFERATAMDLEESRNCIFEALTAATLRPGDIDKVILTGGSSQVPSFIKMVENIFSPDRLIHSDHFTAVALGLGLRARQIYS